jgi:hypothetical protein
VLSFYETCSAAEVMALFHIFLLLSRVCSIFYLTFVRVIAIPCVHNSRIRVVTMAGAAIAIDDAAAADTILSVKQRVFAADPKLFVRRQRLVYSAGPRGMDALADDETLGGAGVARDGTAELDVLVADLTAEEVKELSNAVRSCVQCIQALSSCFALCISAVKAPASQKFLVASFAFELIFVEMFFPFLETSWWNLQSTAVVVIFSRCWQRAPTLNTKMIGYGICFAVSMCSAHV